MSFEAYANWTPIEVLWLVFAAAGLFVGVFNLRRSRGEFKAAAGYDERVYAIGAMVRDTGRVIAQTFGTIFGLYAGFFVSTEPSVFGSLIFMAYIGMYTIGSVSDAVVRYLVTQEK